MIHPAANDMATVEAGYAGVPVLVLGGAGFIGSWVVRALSACGATVSVAARDAAGAAGALAREGIRARVVAADVSVAGTVNALVDTERPAVVFNLAVHGVDHSERDQAAMAAVNTRLVIDLCGRLATETAHGWQGVRLVQVGSALEYGPVSGGLSEDVPPYPTTEYGRSKLLATEHVTRVAAETGLPAVVARLFTVYGPGEHEGRLLPSLVSAARTGRRVSLTSGAQRRDFTYVEDAVEGLLRLGAGRISSGAVVNVATGRMTSVREFAETAASALHLEPDALEFGALPIRGEEMGHGEVDLSRLRGLTEWVPQTTIAEGIRRSLEWEHGQR